MFYFRSRHGLTCRWPPPQACPGSRFWCRGSPFALRTSRKLPPVRARSPRSRPPWSPRPCACRGLISRLPRRLSPPPRIRSPGALGPGRAAPGDDEGEVAVGPASSVASSCRSSGSSTRMPVTCFAGEGNRVVPRGNSIRDRVPRQGVTELKMHHKVAAAPSQPRPCGRIEAVNARGNIRPVSGTGGVPLLAHYPGHKSLTFTGKLT